MHVPYCKSKCGYCSFCSSTDFSTQKLYIKSLYEEICKRGRNEPCDTVYIGGGTPSVLPRGEIDKLIWFLRESFNIEKDAEITVEANPDTCSDDFLREIKRAGVNRLSLGLQSDDDKLLRIAGRRHDYATFEKCLHSALDMGIDNISADLILGLPNQTLNGFEKTVKNVSSLPLKHISVYALKIEEGTAFFDDGVCIDEDLQAEMYALACGILQYNGFLRYEVSNFAEKGFESRHNSKYWDHSPYIGLGLAAHSFVDGYRIENTNNVSLYNIGKREKGREKIPQNELIEEYIMLSLRTSAGIDLNLLEKEYNHNILMEKKEEIEYLRSLGAVEIDGGRLKVTEKAFYILDSIILKLL